MIEPDTRGDCVSGSRLMHGALRLIVCPARHVRFLCIAEFRQVRLEALMLFPWGLAAECGSGFKGFPARVLQVVTSWVLEVF